MAHPHPQDDLQNPDTSHETSDVNIRAIIWFVVVLSATAVAIHLSMYGMFQLLAHMERTNEPPVSPLATPAGTLPPEPRLQVTPWTDLKQMRAEEFNYLHGYGWIDQKSGAAHIPIEKAKAMLLEKGIPVRPELGDASEGTHVASMGESNGGRTLPAGGPDRSSVPPAAPAVAPTTAPAPKTPGGGGHD